MLSGRTNCWVLVEIPFFRCLGETSQILHKFSSGIAVQGSEEFCTLGSKVFIHYVQRFDGCLFEIFCCSQFLSFVMSGAEAAAELRTPHTPKYSSPKSYRYMIPV